MKIVQLRFYEELNDFLSQDKKKIRFEHQFIDRTSVKDLIESFGVPHTEIDMILVNGRSVSFDYIINDKDDISVYPVYESFDISDIQHLRPKPLRDPKFICDVHLGKLAGNLRMLGIDTAYNNNYSDIEIVKQSLLEKRAILTRDLGILKRTEVTHGYFLRSKNSINQTKAVIERFHLKSNVKVFTRCLQCNTELCEMNKTDILDRLPQKVSESQNRFFICSNCDKIYWRGTHFNNMLKKLNLILEK